jgi:hypothetical protein
MQILFSSDPSMLAHLSLSLAQLSLACSLIFLLEHLNPNYLEKMLGILALQSILTYKAPANTVNLTLYIFS